ncbi:MAG: hypothetical protein JW973_13510 [Bacteroidales bacterium]|nr:hypothetical protein [Bacteroidales bacterium]
MLQHIAFAINNQKEIEAFYEKILLFTAIRNFSINSKLSQTIFNVPERTDVYVMGNNDIQFEIFITQREERKVFSHICLGYVQSETIYNKAVNAGYKAIIRERSNSCTYFIWDKSGNMFEIKEQ